MCTRLKGECKVHVEAILLRCNRELNRLSVVFSEAMAAFSELFFEAHACLVDLIGKEEVRLVTVCTLFLNYLLKFADGNPLLAACHTALGLGLLGRGEALFRGYC